MKRFGYLSAFVSLSLAAAAAGLEKVSIPELRNGTHSFRLADGKTFAFEVRTAYPDEPSAHFIVREAPVPRRAMEIDFPRLPFWRNGGDASVGDHWVDSGRDGDRYYLRGEFAAGDDISFSFRFDEGARPGAAKADPADEVWRVVCDDGFGEADAEKASRGELPKGTAGRFALEARYGYEIDLARFRPDYVCGKSNAVVWREIASDRDREVACGAAADWFFTAYLNGEKVYTTQPDGNRFYPFTPYDHAFRLKLRKGVNRLAFHVSPGSDSWSFLCRTFPDETVVPADAKERGRFLRAMFPERCELKGRPWTCRVSTDRAAVGAELTSAGELGLRYAPAGRADAARETWTLTAGQRERAKVHLFGLEGLEPGTEYAYELLRPDGTTGKSVTVAKGTFRTFPAKGLKQSFALTGDLHFDCAGRTKVLRRELKSGAFASADFFVSLGDIANAFDDFSACYHESYLDVLIGGGMTCPAVVVRGNHEFEGRESTEFPRHFGRPYCSFSHGDVFYFVLDTLEAHGQTWRNDLGAWLDGEVAWLEAEIARPECRAARRRVVLAHTHPFGFDWTSAKGMDRLRAPFVGESPRCRIDAWFCGDAHSAYRWDPVGRTLVGQSRNVLPRVKPEDARDVRFPVFVNDGPCAGWAKQSVTRAEFAEDGALTVTVRNADGGLLDRVVVREGKAFEVVESHWPLKVAF